MPHAVNAEWSGITVTNCHKPLSAYFQAFLREGFRLLDFLEPIPNAAQEAAEPGLADYYVSPFFNILH